MRETFQRPIRPALLRAVRVLVAMSVVLGHVSSFADVTTKAEKKDSKKKKEDFIPEARDGAATFVAGDSVDIELSASVATVKQVDFIIRTQPQNGTLSAVRPHPRESNKGIVTYTHKDRNGPLSDRFTFACRVDAGPVSAPATVTLTGQKYEARLEVLEVTAMDRVFFGGESVLRFSVKNSGAAPFSGDFAWPAPWSGPAHIELKAGEKQVYVVGFKPDEPRIYRFDMMLQAGMPASKLPLYGECVRSLTLSPGKLTLEFNRETGTRQGVLTLANARIEPLRVELKIPDRLRVKAGTVEVPGQKKVEVAVSLAESDVPEFRGQITAISTQGVQSVNVDAAPKPALLKVVSPEGRVLDLGVVAEGTEAKGRFEVKNLGGVTALVDADTSAPFSVSPSDHAVRIEPGAKASFEVSASASQPGTVRGEVEIGSPPDMIRLPVTLEVRTGNGVNMSTKGGGPAANTARTISVKSPGERPVDAKAVQAQLLAYLASSGIPLAPDKVNPYLAKVDEVTIMERTSTSITISWKKPAVAPSSWLIEFASMYRVPESGHFVKVWNPLRDWKPVDAGADRVAANLHSLPVASQIDIRIMGVDREGKMSEPGMFHLSTAERWKMPSWVWRTLLVTGLLAALYVLYRIRRGDLEWKWRWRAARA